MIRYKTIYDVKAMTDRERAVFFVWKSMRQRCKCPTDHAWPRYGGRGIMVCERWDKSFMDFVEDMGIPEASGLDLDRENNDGNYEKSNCRWVTHQVNLNNYSRNRRVKIGGKERTSAEWCTLAGIDRSTFCCRLKAGWTGEDLLLPSSRITPIEIEGVTKSAVEWARLVPMSMTGFLARLHKGVTGSALLEPSQKAKEMMPDGKISP